MALVVRSPYTLPKHLFLNLTHDVILSMARLTKFSKLPCTPPLLRDSHWEQQVSPGL